MSFWSQRKGVPEKEPSVHPVLDSRRTYNDQVSAALSHRFLLSVMTLLAMITALASIAGLVHIGSRSKFVPYVVKLDQHGRAVGVSDALPAPLDGATTMLVTQGLLADFIYEARLVTPDAKVQFDVINRLYTKLDRDDPARRKMDEWLNAEPSVNPFERARRVTVTAEVTSVLPISDVTWQVDWVERVTERDGTPKEEFRMRALVTVYRRLPTRETKDSDRRANPMGVFVKDFQWSRLA